MTLSRVIKGVIAAGALLVALGGHFLWSRSQDEARSLISASAPGEEGELLVSGTVEAVGGGADMARQIRTVFVILKDENARPPYAVRRLTNSENTHLLSFSLTQNDVMIPGASAPRNPVLKIRFDADGDPMTELPGDVIAQMHGFGLGEQGLSLRAEMLEKPSGM